MKKGVKSDDMRKRLFRLSSALRGILALGRHRGIGYIRGEFCYTNVKNQKNTSGERKLKL